QLLQQSPARRAMAIPRRHGDDAVQVIRQDHSGGERERVALTARAPRELQRIDIVGQGAGLTFFQRGGEEVLGGLGAGVHARECRAARASRAATFGRCAGTIYVAAGGALPTPSALRNSIGSGNTMVELLSPAMLPSVCR